MRSPRNFVPQPGQIDPKQVQQREPDDAIITLASVTADQVDAITQFLVSEFPRGPLPQGPVTATPVVESDSIKLAWLPELMGATIDWYSIWRADAGTTGSPTTPAFTSALRLTVVPTGRVSRIPKGSGFQWFDLGFTAADRTNGKRFRYWLASIDNEFRESGPVDFGIATVPASGGGGGMFVPTGTGVVHITAGVEDAASMDPIVGSYTPGSFTIPTGKYAVMTNFLQLTGVQQMTIAGTGRLRIT